MSDFAGYSLFVVAWLLIGLVGGLLVQIGIELWND
jgi:hypothetical protein